VNIHEYQAKEIFRDAGIPIPPGEIATTPEEAERIARKLGGTVVVKGNVGARAGDQMRRGMILVAGDAGDYLGSRMSGGTVVVMGEVGPLAGYAMKRGTLLLRHSPKGLPPTFNDCGTHPLGFLTLLLPAIRRHGEPFAGLTFPANHARRWMGDAANLGRGEILVPENRSATSISQ